MDLIVNGIAIANSSYGARRYYDAVMTHLDWPGRVKITHPGRRQTARMREMLERGRSDAIFWSPCHRGPLFARNHVVTVLDCINIEYVYRDNWRLPILKTVFSQLLDNAVRVVCISKATRAAVERNFEVDPDKLVVIPGPIDVGTILPMRARSPDPERHDFVLMITNPLIHKNTARAGQCFAASSAARRNIGLKVVGRMDPIGLAACADAGVTVEQYNNIPDSMVQTLMQDCKFFWSPSLDEGLNLTIAEALALNTDVLGSDIAVHREFYDGEITFFDPTSASAMKDAIEAAFTRAPGWYPRKKFSVRPSSRDVASHYRALFETLAREIA